MWLPCHTLSTLSFTRPSSFHFHTIGVFTFSLSPLLLSPTWVVSEQTRISFSKFLHSISIGQKWTWRLVLTSTSAPSHHIGSVLSPVFIVSQFLLPFHSQYLFLHYLLSHSISASHFLINSLTSGPIAISLVHLPLFTPPELPSSDIF